MMHFTGRPRRTTFVLLAFFLLTAALICVPVTQAHAAPIYVSATGSDALGNGSLGNPYATVQHAIGMAASGDSIQVGIGTFTGDITLKDGVSLYGSGAGSTTLRGTGASPVVTAIGISQETTVTGFTITRVVGSGGGIYCWGSSIVIVSNIISGNTGAGVYSELSTPTIAYNTIVSNDGGGVECSASISPSIKYNTIASNTGFGIRSYSSNPLIVGNTITGNTASGSGGGGIYCEGSTTLISGNTISGNVAPNSGGGIFLTASVSSTVTANIISGNSASNGGGGGILLSNAPFSEIANNMIAENSAPNGGGGAIFCTDSASVVIRGNDIQANITGTYGGGILCSNSSPTIEANTISNNTSSNYGGGGICASNGSAPQIVNNTITANQAANYGGGGIYSYGASAPNIVNNTITTNTAAGIYGGGGIYAQDPAPKPTIWNNIIWDNGGDDLHGCSATYSDISTASDASGVGNISMAPSFVGTATGDFTLHKTSPCIDVATPAGAPAVDAVGNVRPHGGGWDMGAYECVLPYDLKYGAGSGGSLTGATAQTVAWGGSSTPVTAVPNAGHHFVNWSDGSASNPRVDTPVTADLDVTANFAINTYTLTYNAGPGGTLSGAAAQTVDYGTDGTPVLAVPDTQYHFVNWSDASTANPRTDLNVTANHTVTANFVLNSASSIHVELWGSDATGDGSASKPYATVQYAIDHAVSGNDVLIGRGSFHGKVVMKDGVSLYGTGPLSTSLTETDSVPVVSATNIGPGTTISSIEVTGGVVGIRVDNSSLRITGNIIGETSGTIGPGGGVYGGQGIYCMNFADPIINYNIIEEGAGDATGIRCEGFSMPTISYNTISGANTSGIISYASSPIIRYNTIVNNVAAIGGGGGIYCESSPAIITDNTITGNSTEDGYGGGIYLVNANPTIRRNVITGNRADVFGGGGIALSNSSPTIVGNTISQNSSRKNAASTYGGAGILSFAGSAPSIIDNIIADNELANGYGAGIMCSNSSPTISGNLIARNVIKSPANSDLGFGGGGIALSNSSPAITDNEIIDNVASNFGGGGILCFDGSSPAITSNSIGRNKAENYGGAGIMAFDFSSPVITNCTIYENVAQGITGGGGGIYVGQDSAPRIMNSTIYGNSTSGPVGAGVFAQEPIPSPTITNSIIYDNEVASGDKDDLYGCTATFSDVSSASDLSGAGNISASPTFEATSVPIPSEPDFHLRPSSPCVNVATPTGAPTVDKDGTARPQGPGFDMGAYECVTITLTYTAGAHGTLSGTSPQLVGYNGSGTPVTAVPDIGYHFVNWSDGSTANPRTDKNVKANVNVTANFAIDTFTLTYTAGANGAVLGTSPQTVNYNGSGTAVTAVPAGGYRFASWSDGSVANPRIDTNVKANVNATANFTLDNGVHPDIYVETWGSDGFGDGSPSNPYKTVPYAMNTALQGDTIHVGIGNFAGGVTMRNGVSLFGSGPTATTLTGTGTGPVITAANVSASATIGELTITGGAGSPGGGVYCQNTASWLTIRDAVVSGNSGGGINLVNSSPLISRNIIRNNQGSGIFCSASSPTITANEIMGNAASVFGGGGIMCFSSSSPSIVNNTITQNTASGTGGGAIACFTNSAPTIINDTIFGNTALLGDGIYAPNASPKPTIFNCIIWSNGVDDLSGCTATYSDISTPADLAGAGNISTVPLFVAADNFHLQPTSPCIDVATATGAPAVDKDGTGRPQGPGYDMGAYETIRFALSYSAGAHGTVTGATAQTVGFGGSGTAVTAVPDTGYHFVNWSDGSGANPRTDTNVQSNISVTANFSADAFTLTYVAGLHGTVTGPNPQTVPYDGSGVAVTANPDPGYRFANWSDGSPSNPRIDTGVKADITVTAIFVVDTGVHPDIYVEVWGNNAAGDGSPGNPYATVPYAMGTAIPGDTIHVGIGTFPGDVAMRNDVSLLGAGSAATILKGSGKAPVITAAGLTSPATIAHMTISGGKSSQGGGVHVSGVGPALTITDNIITGNDGGGIYCSTSSPTISFNTIATNAGGGIFLFSSSPAINGNAISDNAASNYGGGGIMCFSSSSPSITNNTIFNNTAAGLGGGGIACSTSSAPSIVNNTIVGNTAVIGGGVYAPDASPKPTIKNCIVWDNGDDLAGCTATYSDISNSIIASGLGNLTLSPSFVATDTGDFHLTITSPCIDVGTSTGAPTRDKDQARRPFGRGFDVGAYEYSGLPVYRFYNSKLSVHFYTASEAEKQYIIANLSSVYHFEGIAYRINTANPANNKPLYRFYNMQKGVHFYTASAVEKDLTIANLSSIYKYEGIAYYVCTSPPEGSKTVWRFYNMKQGVHFYTADEDEKDNTIANLSATYHFEGPGFYLAP